MSSVISRFALLFAVLGLVAFAVPASFAGEEAEGTDVAAPADEPAEETGGEASGEEAEGESEEAQPE